MLSHLIDYSMWYNDYARPSGPWPRPRASASSPTVHASPDYIGGFVQFANGVRGIYECGAGAPDEPEVQRWWGKNRIGARAPRASPRSTRQAGAPSPRTASSTGDGAMNYDQDMPPYIQDMADWLDRGKVHPCCFENAYAGFEVMMGMLRSAARGGQITLPLLDAANELEELQRALSGAPLQVTLEESRKEYNS